MSQTARFATMIKRHPVKTQRFLEILPGLFSWSLILFPIWGSMVFPEVVAYYIIGFNIYWLYKSVTMAVLSIMAHFRLKATMAYNWMTDVKQFPDWERVHHIVVIPTYKEPVTTLQRTLDNLAKQTFPTRNLVVVLAFEEREGAAAKDKAQALTQQYNSVFGHLLTTFHPDIEGEVKGKSSNTSWGAKVAKKYIVDQQQVPISYITITSEDSDALLDHQYFAALTYQFLDSPKRYERIWQAGIMFYNNIWRVPGPVRILASTLSVSQLYILMRPDNLINFSTYSMSLKLIDEVGYWDTDVIPEDYRVFFKTYFATEGKVSVEPIFLPVLSDAAESNSFWGTMTNQYEQIKRWAWGVSDDSYVIKQWLTVPNMPFWEKTMRVFHVLENHFLWPVNWFAITVGALIPPLMNPKFSQTVMGKTLPQTSSAILTIALISMLVMVLIDAANRPPRPGKTSIIKKILQPLEFIWTPVIGFFFSALPGLDAHTRLMLGRYIEYRVTEKV